MGIFSNTGNILKGPSLPPPPPPLPLSKEVLRVNLCRIMDDLSQTLGVMDVLNKDGKILYSLATVELPWNNNQNVISCIPMGNYRVISYSSGKYGRCFWLIGNDNGGYQDNRITGNGYTRGSILMYATPKATKNLQGSIGLGLKFNTQTNQMGNQKGTGQFYLSPAKEQSQQALNKLLNTLYNVGSFRMEIKSAFPTVTDEDKNVYPALPQFFSGVAQQYAQKKNLAPNPYIAPK